MHKELTRIPIVIYRGGTSKAVFVKEYDLPNEGDKKDRVVCSLFGSPDKRQIDGLGGADPLTSKLAIISPATRDDADVDYEFAQVDITTPTVYYGAVCGNITTAVGPYAIEEGFVPACNGETVVRVHSRNIGRIIKVTVPTPGKRVQLSGDYRIDGVPGAGAKIDLNWADTGGAKTGALLPTGNSRDTLTVDGIGEIEVSVVDVGNVGVFVRAEDLGLSGTETPEDVDTRPEVIATCDAVAQAVMKQIDNIAFLTFVSPATEYVNHVTGETVSQSDADILVRMIFLGSMHKAYAASQINCCGAAAMIPGTVVHETVSGAALKTGIIRLGHPAGIATVKAGVNADESGYSLQDVVVSRTARRLLEGVAFINGGL